MIKFNLLLIIFAFYISFDDAKAQKFSLLETQNFAVENHSDIKNSKLDIEIAKKKIWETTAIGLPQFTAKIAYTYMPEVAVMEMPASMFDPNAPAGAIAEIPMGLKNNTTIDFTLSQLIFSGEYLVGLQASKTFSQVSEKNLIKTKLEIKSNVTETYYLVLVVKENKKILINSLDVLQKILNETEKMYKLGFVEDTDVSQFKLTVMNLENSLNTLDKQINVASRLLKFQMGMELDKKIELTENLEDILKKVNFKNYLEKKLVINENIDFQIMEKQEEIQKLEFKRQKSTILPTISAFINHQKKAKAPEMDMAPPTIMGINIEIPIFASGIRYTKISQAKMEFEKIENQKKTLKKALILENLQAKSDFQSSKDKYENEKLSMALAKKIYEKTSLKYKEGISSSLDLTQAQNQYLSAQSNYFNAIFELLKIKNKLDKINHNELKY